MGAITLKDALESLDPANDAQWTADGLPRMDVVETLIGDKAITRIDVTEADLEFCREVSVQRRDEAKKAKEADEAQKAKEAKEVEEADEAKKAEEADEAKKAEEVELARKAEEKQNDTHPEMQTETPKINPQEQLRADILALDEQIKELGVEKNAIEKIITETQCQRDALQQKSFGSHSAKEDTKARMVFIKSQNKARAERYERGRRILQIVGKDGLNPKCRLDQAMTRKTARGTRRPPPRTPIQP